MRWDLKCFRNQRGGHQGSETKDIVKGEWSVQLIRLDQRDIQASLVAKDCNPEKKENEGGLKDGMNKVNIWIEGKLSEEAYSQEASFSADGGDAVE